jgi:hypothetical protein
MSLSLIPLSSAEAMVPRQKGPLLALHFWDDQPLSRAIAAPCSTRTAGITWCSQANIQNGLLSSDIDDYTQFHTSLDPLRNQQRGANSEQTIARSTIAMLSCQEIPTLLPLN